jgi:hypothetical protein
MPMLRLNFNMSSPPGGMVIARAGRGLDAAARGSGLPCVLRHPFLCWLVVVISQMRAREEKAKAYDDGVVRVVVARY